MYLHSDTLIKLVVLTHTHNVSCKSSVWFPGDNATRRCEARGHGSRRHINTHNKQCRYRSYPLYLKLPVCRLQKLFGLICGASSCQDELVYHHLMF